jgi:hypothetical protein
MLPNAQSFVDLDYGQLDAFGLPGRAGTSTGRRTSASCSTTW